MNELLIFVELLKIENVDHRLEKLSEITAGDAALRARVEELIDAHARASNFMATSHHPGAGGRPTSILPEAETTGTIIGPYKLLQEIGEGGMGTVFMAEQSKPVQRRVALKIIKPGMDTRQVIARFEAERQALALMEHPNIAKVLDAGATAAGRPYFVMELVKGTPITKYCDDKQLTLKHRLELFMQVCHAISHAHQKGIIHRDIKPTNVLVAQYDGKPIPKVIDFGVAKATAQKLTEKTMFTEFGMVIGTMEYMSPEQAEVNQLDIDTRSDVYSLGVVLYELLTGETPLESKKLRSAAHAEMLRMIREEDPSRPSIKLSTSAGLPNIASRRGADGDQLKRSVKGELDWIVMRALEKDRTRRYESVSAFADDVGRHLSDEPVLACPPSFMYRLSKHARRNRAWLTSAALLAAVLVTSTIVSVLFALQAERSRRDTDEARQDAEKQKTAALAAKQLASERLDQSRLDFDRALKSLDTIVEEVTSQDFAQMPHASRMRQKIIDKAVQFYEEIIADHHNDPYARMQHAVAHKHIADIYQWADDHRGHLDEINTAIAMLEQLIREFPDEFAYQQHWGSALFSRMHSQLRTSSEKLADAEAGLKNCQREVELGLMTTPEHLILMYYKVAENLPTDSPRARELVEESIRAAKSHGLPPIAPTQIWLAQRAEEAGELRQAEEYYIRGIEGFEKMGAEAGRRTRYIERWLAGMETQNLARLYEKMDQTEQAGTAYRRALSGARQLCSEYPANPVFRRALADCQQDLCKFLQSQGGTAEAKLILDELLSGVPDSTDGHDRRRRIIEELSDDPIRELTEAILEFPDQSSFFIARAQAYQKRMQFDLAWEDICRAMKIGGAENLEMLQISGELRHSRGDYREAVADFTRCLSINRNNWWLYKRRAHSHFRLGEFEKTLADLETGLKGSSSDLTSTIWIPAAEIAACPDAAFREGYVKLLNTMVELNQQSTHALTTRAAVLIAMGRQAAARADIESANARMDSFQAQYEVALLSLAIGDLQRYRTVCGQIASKLENSPDPSSTSSAVWACALAPNAVDDYASVKAAARAAVDKFPRIYARQLHLGAILLRSGELDEAKQVLEQALETATSNHEPNGAVHYFLAILEHHMGRHEAAKDQLLAANRVAQQQAQQFQSWHRTVAYNSLRSEATQLIGGTGPESNPVTASGGS